MAILKFGAIVTSGSGSLGGHTIQHSKGGMQIRTKPIPRGNPSASQTLIRSINQQLQAGWRQLTSSQQKIWNDWPSTHGIMNAKGDKHPLSGHSLWMKYQYGRLIENLPFLSDPSKHLPTYLGPELVDQISWLTPAYYNAQLDPNWSFNGIKLISNGGSGFCIHSSLFMPGLSYQVKIYAVGSGLLSFPSEVPLQWVIPFSTLFIRNGFASHHYFYFYSQSFIGYITMASAKQIFNYL